jgi:hypothetical protein
MSNWRRIRTAYEAWWFLHEHPKFHVREQQPVTAGEAESKIKNTYIRRDKNSNLWRVWKPLGRNAINHNMDIHYAAVDAKGRVNDDESKNIFRACWLEFGQMKWGYHSVEFETGDGQTAREYVIHEHDIDLDCGGKTFDEALVKLARLVMKKYGDYQKPEWVK